MDLFSYFHHLYNLYKQEELYISFPIPQNYAILMSWGTDSVNAGNSESEGQAVTNVAEGFLAAMGGEVILWI